MSDLFDDMGGPATIARKLGIKAPSVWQWREQGRIPPDRRVELEKLFYPQFWVERAGVDVIWLRVADPAWPHPMGRPCRDDAATLGLTARGSVGHLVTLPPVTASPLASATPATPVTGGNRAGDPAGRALERQAQDKAALPWPACGERRNNPPEVPGSGAVTRRRNPDLRAAEKAL